MNGLKNVGNTCFMNAALQLLKTVPAFVNGSVPFQTFVEQNDPTMPRAWVAEKFPQFRNYAQHDSHEWLLSLLDTLNADTAFQGTFEVTVTFRDCGHSNVHDEPFVTLSLPMVGQTLAESLHDFFTRADAVVSTCDTCADGRKQAATKTVKILTLPAAMLIHWKRFSGRRGEKVKRRMTTPSTLFNKQLTAMVNHVGEGSGSGHYTACVATKTPEYYYISDTSVLKIEKKHFLKSVEAAYYCVYV